MNTNKNFIITQTNELEWVGKIEENIICSFKYFKDKHGYWINNIFTEHKYQQNKTEKYGTRMLKKAIEVYGKVFISNATRLEVNDNQKYKGDEGFTIQDSRYTNDNNLMNFIEKCIEKGIVDKDWIKNPFKL